MDLLDLPLELLIQILCCLDLPDIISCTSTNRLLHTVVKETVHIQYHIHLQLHGLIDNPSCSLSIDERLGRLKAREEAWNALKPNFQWTIPVHHQTSNIYDLTGGVLVLGEGHQAPFPITNTLMHVVLPSFENCGTHGTGSEWSRIDPKSQVLDVGMAVEEHDLIAVVARRLRSPGSPQLVVEIQLLQFSTGKPHPSARHPSLLLFGSSLARHTVSVEVVGNHLALILRFILSTRRPKFFLYDWKTGKLNMFSNLDRGHESLLFLDHQTLLLTNLAGSLDLVPIPDFNKLSFTVPIPLRITQSLLLPGLFPNFHYRAIHCRASPNPKGPGPVLFPPHAQLPHHRQPFHSSSEDAIVLFNIYIIGGDSINLLFVHRKALLAHLRPLDSLPSSLIPSSFSHSLDGTDTIYDVAVAPRPLPWTDWGPLVCRWYQRPRTHMTWVTTTTGQRYVEITGWNPHAEPCLIALDFNPHHVRLSDRPIRDTSRLIPWGENGGGPFSEPVDTSLPFIVVASKAPHPYTSVMMDEERIIGFQLDDERNITSIDVLHLG